MPMRSRRSLSSSTTSTSANRPFVGSVDMGRPSILAWGGRRLGGGHLAWQKDGEGRAFAERAPDLDPAAMRGHDPLGARQPEPNPGRLLMLGRGPEEGVEDPGLVFGRDA